MALETLKTFVEKAKTDETLQRQVVVIAEKRDRDAMVALMEEHGVSEGDLQALREQEEALKTGESDELSDEMLDLVAGGGCWSKIGGACALVHHEPGAGCAILHWP